MSNKRRDFSKMPKEERQKLVEKIFVEYPRLTALLEKMRHCLSYSKIAAEPECMFIGGYAGTGKTTLYEYFEAEFPRRWEEDGAKIPVLSSAAPQRATEKTLVGEILESMGDPMAKKGTADNQTSRLRKLIKECRVEIIILDEFQHFVDADSKKVLKNVSDWLKNLINATKTPIVLIGQPNAVKVLDETGNEQLQRRFLVRETLEPFGWMNGKVVNTGKRKEFRGFLEAVDEELPFNERSNLSEPTMAYRFYCGTNGRVNRIMAIVRRAAELAISESRVRLDLDVLAAAYEDRLRKLDVNRQNPFRTEFKDLSVVPFRDERAQLPFDDDEEGGETSSDVLKT